MNPTTYTINRFTDSVNPFHTPVSLLTTGLSLNEDDWLVYCAVMDGRLVH
jgi:hypothetical protein